MLQKILNGKKNRLVLELKSISKKFKDNDEELLILDAVNFSVMSGEIVVIIGESGSGKTTILQLMGLMDKPDAGYLYICGKKVNYNSERKKILHRRHSLGFIFQFHHLLPEFSILENVALPLMIQGKNKAIALAKSKDYLDKVGLLSKAKKTYAKISGGERQRVAIARSLINNPEIILADEPTGNLDLDNANKVMDVFIDCVRSLNKSAVIVTHSQNIIDKADRVFRLNRGKLSEV